MARGRVFLARNLLLGARSGLGTMTEGRSREPMGGAAGFIWVMVVILALAWALVQTGTVRVGVDFNLWVNILLGLAVLGAIFNLFVIPFLGRRTTTTTAADARGSAT